MKTLIEYREKESKEKPWAVLRNGKVVKRFKTRDEASIYAYGESGIY